MTRIVGILGLALLLCLGCKSRKAEEGDSPKTEVTADSTSLGCEALTKARDGKMDPIISVRPLIEDDCLHLKLTYGGGCKEHKFQLLWNGAWMKSMPPQVTLMLSHENGGDMCRSIKSEKLSYNLLPIRAEGLGQVIVNVKAPGTDLIRVNYMYK